MVSQIVGSNPTAATSVVFFTLCQFIVLVAEYNNRRPRLYILSSWFIIVAEHQTSECIASSAQTLSSKSPHSVHVIHIYLVWWGKTCHLLHVCLKHDHKSLNTSPVMDWPDKSRVGYLYLALNCLVWTFNM